MYTVEKLLQIAIAELGYLEKASNAQLDDKTANAGKNNYTKYARDLHTAGYYQAPKNGYAWCDMFVDWCFLQLGGSKQQGEYLECQTGLYGAGCEWSSNCYRWAGRFGTEPRVGAQIFFGKTGAEEHTGLVEKFDDTYVYTIEGNTSPSAGVVPNGGGVHRKTYKRNNARIVGYGYPRYDAADAAPEAPKPEVEIKYADDVFQKGDIVTIKSGAKYYNGNPVPAWVRKLKWIVAEAADNSDRVVIDKSTNGKFAICSPISYHHLEEVVPETVAPEAPVVSDTNEKVTVDAARGYRKDKAGTYRVTAGSGLHVRTGASTTKKSITVLPAGTKVTCYGYFTNEWLYIMTANGTVGFCHSSYLKKV